MANFLVNPSPDLLKKKWMRNPQSFTRYLSADRIEVWNPNTEEILFLENSAVEMWALLDGKQTTSSIHKKISKGQSSTELQLISIFYFLAKTGAVVPAKRDR